LKRIDRLAISICHWPNRLLRFLKTIF